MVSSNFSNFFQYFFIVKICIVRRKAISHLNLP
jgi:hypothetical protein